jgi:SnoaL-like domain
MGVSYTPLLRLAHARQPSQPTQCIDAGTLGPHMSADHNRDAVERWYRAFNARDFRQLGALLEELADPDVVQDWPQSGERIRGRANILAVLENYPGLPDAAIKNVRGAEDKWILTRPGHRCGSPAVATTTRSRAG